MLVKYDSSTSKLSLTSPFGEAFTRERASLNAWTLTLVAEAAAVLRGEDMGAEETEGDAVASEVLEDMAGDSWATVGASTVPEERKGLDASDMEREWLKRGVRT